jgi:hypothetical protein
MIEVIVIYGPALSLQFLKTVSRNLPLSKDPDYSCRLIVRATYTPALNSAPAWQSGPLPILQ